MLSYSVTGSNYIDFYNVSSLSSSSIGNVSTSYTDTTVLSYILHDGNYKYYTYLDIRLNLTEDIRHIQSIKYKGYWYVPAEPGQHFDDGSFFEKVKSITIPFTSIDSASVKLNLKSKDSAWIEWKPTITSWIDDAAFVITRINNTTKAKTVINLSKEDFYKGSYVDDEIAVCNEYSYTLQVVPPKSSGVTAFASIKTTNTITPTDIGTVSNLTASKGYFPDRAELRWRTKGGFDYFIIKRAQYGTDNYVQLSSVTNSSFSDYEMDDTKGLPGVYYKYMLVGVVNCNNKPIYSKDTLYAIGFRSPTGNINGRITYVNGQAVEHVGVRLQSNDAAQLGQSIYLRGDAQSYLVLNKPFAMKDASFTVECWIKPDDTLPKNQVLFSRSNQYELGFQNNGQLYFSFNGETVTGNYFNPQQSFVHIAGIHSKDSLLLMLNDSVIARIAASPKVANNIGDKEYVGRNADGDNFKGYIDEMRIWNIALSPAQIAQDYTRMLVGNEPGLAAYWRFDETIKNQFYDLSYLNDQHNQNDGTMDSNSVNHSNFVPTPDQLSLKGYTDSTGNYMISGVPFTGNGTAYSIVPLLGTHQFDPASVNRLVSATSSQFTVDFKDKSAFYVSGSVYYHNSTVPVAGVQFKIDGQYAQQSDGTILETDASGKFTISVPIGKHKVQAVKNNHVFEKRGYITDRFGNDLNYQDNLDLSNIQFNDSTTVRFIGRVSGGIIQDGLPLGHSVSVNNLGKQLSFTMKLFSGTQHKLYSPTPEKTVINKHFLPSDQTDSNNIHKTRVVYQEDQILIYPDSLTGEFIADMIPEKFLASNVMATGWGDILEGNSTTIDFTDKFSVQNSVRTYEDSVQNNQGKWVKKTFADTVRYNVSYKFIKRKTPSVTITQVDANGNPLPYFGSKTYQTYTLVGSPDTVSLIDSFKTGKDMYIFGRPVFIQNQPYDFLIKAFEAYPFYERVNNNNVGIVKQVNGKDVIDNVPTQDGIVSIYNNLRNGATAAETDSLNSNGAYLYPFRAGDPDLASQGVKDFAATIRFGQATNIDWQWYGGDPKKGAPKMDAFVLGGKLTGFDFVTAGPDKILMVLRDPPGSKSFSYAEKGSVTSSSSKYSGSIKNEGDINFKLKLGYELITFVGIGAGIINKDDFEATVGYGIHHEEHYTGSDTKEQTNTLTTRWQTSDDPLFVGPPGDVFVGYSTNMTYGQSNNITIIKRSELKVTDVVVYEPDTASSRLVIKRAGINIGETFGTMFAYPQQHIQFILIPNLINIRNSVLLPVTTTAVDAQTMANNTKAPVYVSKLSPNDKNFGKSNSDTLAFGATAKTDPFGDGKSYKIYFSDSSLYRTDTILTLNQYVKAWQQRMADNEKQKLEMKVQQNYSFHSGAPIEHSTETGTKNEHEDEFSFVISGAVTGSTEFSINETGFEFELKESVGTEQGGTFTSTKENLMKYGFTLASEGTDDYFSVDVGHAGDDGSFVFRTKGGSSGCPYAGSDTTKYYLHGTVLNQPTLRNEVPVITVDKPVVSNVPSSRKAYYTLYLKNESEAKLPETYVLSYVNNDSIKGATISVDGLSIAQGRAIPIQYGETIEKVLTIEMGPTTMDYNNIMILWHSGCQYDPTGYRENIADTVLISAHFIPSCSDINIKFPKDKWVLNTKSPVNQQGKRYLPITIDQFDINNKLFDHIELQFKPSSQSTWKTTMTFYADSGKFLAAQGEKQFITNPAAILYNLEMDNATFNDQHYDIQAVSFCKLGPDSYATTESNLISGIKDTYNPRLFGSPQPANGILGINDEIRLNFNEPIASGSLTYPDFQVTGIRNGLKGDHSVSVRLDGQSNYLATEFDKNLTAKNITTEMWVLPSAPANATLFSQGSINESMELSLTADNYLEVVIGKKTLKSDKAFDYKQGEWAHVALIYNAASKTVSAFYNFIELIHNAPVGLYTGIGHFEFGRSISRQGNFFSGKMHEVRVWSDTLTAIQLQINSLTQLSGAEGNLLAYYPMNEGKGDVCFDKAHGSNAKLHGQWSMPPGKAIQFDGTGYVNMNTAMAPVTSRMDYTIELWFKADPSQSDAILASNGKGDGSDGGGSLDLFSLGFEQGLLTYQNNGFKVQASGNYLDNNWHHVALAVNRNSGNAQFFVDGLLNKYFDAKNLGGIAAASTYLGARGWNADSNTTIHYDRYFTGYVDEFRIWNAYLSQTLISNNNNIRLNGDEIGLMVYYPFEKYFVYQNNKELGFTLSDMKIRDDPKAVVPDAVAVNAKESDDMAPVKDRGPVDNLKFDFVVNNDALIINLLEPKQAIDKTILTFTVSDVKDLNGNPILSPITWTAYIDQNQIKWSDAELNLIKDVYAPMQFESYLINNGGNVQHYRLDNLPSWLTADLSTGTIDPKGKQKITFTVNEGLNVGSYDEIVFMRNDNNESESLKINLKVKAKQPDWKVNPADFKYNMNVYGKIRINNIFSINSEDILAAFMNGRCVGVTRNTYDAKNDLWYAFLTVYSDTLQYGKLEFRIWQASTGKTYGGMPSLPVTFVNNAIIGTARNPVIFDGSEMIFQDIVLNQNWNWISLNVANANFNNISATLGNGNWSSGDMVKNEELGFDQYSSTAGWVGYLNGFNNTSLFMLKAATAQTLSVNGTAVDVKKTAIPLKGNRWNYISYLPQVNMTVKDALAGYNASDEDVIKSQSGFAMYDSRNGWVGNLTYLEPDKGYMLYRKATTDTAFYYPGLNGSLTNHPGRNMAGGYSGMNTVRLNSLQTPVPGNFTYAENMTVIAVAGGDFALQPGDIVLAFAGGELRGKAQLIPNTVSSSENYFLSIGGWQDQLVSFLVERNGEIIAQSDAVINYLANKNLGTVRKPFVLPFKKETKEATLYPNPFTSKVDISVDMSAGQTSGIHNVQMSVYDINGRLVFRQAQETVVSNYYKTAWNGKTEKGSDCLSGVYFVNITIDGMSHVFKVIKL